MDTEKNCAECEGLRESVGNLKETIDELEEEVERLTEESDNQHSALDDIFDIAKRVL